VNEKRPSSKGQVAGADEMARPKTSTGLRGANNEAPAQVNPKHMETIQDN